MSFPIVFRLEAQAEFDEAFDWYEQKQTGLGIDFLNCVAEVLARIGSMPEFYAMISWDVRRAVVQRFPYSIFYRLETAQIVVLAIFHSKHDPKIWQSRT